MCDSIGDSIETPYITNLSELHLEQMSVDTMSADVSLWLDMFLGYVLSFHRRSQRRRSVNFRHNFQKTFPTLVCYLKHHNFLSSFLAKRTQRQVPQRPFPVSKDGIAPHIQDIRENNICVDYDYKVGNKVLIHKDGILRKAESIWRKEPWTITTIHTNGTIRIQCGTKSERINIRRVTPFSEELLT